MSTATASKKMVEQVLRNAGFQQLRAAKYWRHRTEQVDLVVSSDRVVASVPNTLSVMTFDFNEALVWFTAAAQ